MSETELVERAAAPMSKLIRSVSPEQLTAPTPCAEFDVRALLNHLLFWGPSLAGAARKQTVDPPAATESEVDLVAGDWSAALDTYLDDLAAAWRDPSAWQGTTHVAGPAELPAPLIGGMVVTELTVHSWDLSRALHLTPAWDDDLLRFAHDHLEATAPMGRDMGAFGPEVPVAPTAPLLDRLLGLSGRDPHWSR